ncbi:nephrocystin-1-like isoform X2 [Stegodyphus dumicola]|uniref:nephrocystin-1-like isoform X2 n=1 Tax=Stegodyphus dumicola TaxID=202533 RepID=UPI0015AE3783|nr:nephrocystin-1-like isoform X2 [Stegodyphus dumicola]
MCHHDGHKVLSNIHTVKTKWDARTPNLWTFNSKVSTESSLEEGQIFIRSDKCFATSASVYSCQKTMTNTLKQSSTQRTGYQGEDSFMSKH